MKSQAMLLTGPGEAAVAVLRLRGGALSGFLARHFSRPVEPGRCVHGNIVDGQDTLDDAVIVLDPDRGWADVNVHGGQWVVHSVLELARSSGFEVIDARIDALPREAFDAAGELELEVAEAAPRAPTRQALRLLLAQPEQWHQLIAMPLETRRRRVQEVLADRTLHSLLSLPRVAIVGPANAGKSTLANQLFAQERSITADLPGTTRDWIGEVANLDGLAVMLIDTPGLRSTDDAIEREAIARSAGQVAQADLVILVLDGSRPGDAEERAMAARFADALRVINKADLLAGQSIDPLVLRTVATTAQGVDELRAAIRRRLGCGDMTTLRPCWWTPRQRDLLGRM